jgi:hypothetical protein
MFLTLGKKILSKIVFRNVVAVSVQNTFRLEIHKNNIYFLKKIIFDINISKRSENIKKLILNKKIFKFWWNAV